MARLPDDPLDAWAVKACAQAPPSSARSRQQGGTVTVGSDGHSGSDRGGVSTPTTPCCSGSTSRPSSQATMVRLPDEALVAQDPPPAPGPAGGQHAAPGRPAGGQKSSMRDRFQKHISVSVANQTGLPNPAGGTVIRQLADGESIGDLFDFADEIYNGGEKGKVMLAKRTDDGAEIVVKVRVKQTNKGTDRNWRAIMAQVHKLGGTRHVLGISEIIEGPNEFYIVMPRCNGGELFDFLATETEVPESECKRITCEILIAVDHLHKNNIIHRDIKPENIMFDIDRTSEASPKSVRLIDFDTCQEWSTGSPKSRRFVGTPGYIAPEALMGESSPQSDLWSVGVILYILMTGEMPWSSLCSLEDGMVGSPGAKRMYQKLKQEAEVLDWEQEPWPDFSGARDLCQKLLAFNTEERYQTVEEALRHPWLADLPLLRQWAQQGPAKQPGSASPPLP